ncbi:MAG: hypothetical protein C5S40_00135 [ANME-2 cluster archaeon]|nr:hypothetical protein [ANME-2 cluster archaeon]
MIGLGDVDESNSIVADLVVKAGDIVTLSKTLKITSTGRYPDADADADAAEKTLEYYRWVGKPMTVPIVYNTAEPKKDPDTNEFLMLAGGNFYWVSDDGEGDDAKGHNVWGVIFATDSSLDTAPGKTDDECYVCHAMIFDYDDEPTGCAGCHREPHPDADSLITTPGDEYCFLTGHSDGKDLGVTGIKDKKDKDGSDGDWQYSKSSSDHNEYRGIAGDDGSGLKSIGGYPHTTTGYCTGCHGKFHSEQKNAGGDWIRHPSDWVIPLETDITKKFYDAFGSGGTDTGTYDPDVPVARANPTSISSEVNLGSDMVMCLSCHVAHGSQYSDMLRWKYDDMIVGTQGVGKEKGCFKCHTDKDDNEAYLTAGGGKRCYNCHTMHDSQDNVCATPSETSMCDGAYPYLLNGVYVSADCPHPKP